MGRTPGLLYQGLYVLDLTLHGVRLDITALTPSAASEVVDRETPRPYFGARVVLATVVKAPAHQQYRRTTPEIAARDTSPVLRPAERHAIPASRRESPPRRTTASIWRTWPSAALAGPRTSPSLSSATRTARPADPEMVSIHLER